MDRKVCPKCGVERPYSEFNKGNSVGGKRNACKICQRLAHKALAIAAHSQGYTRRDWIKMVPRSERMPILNEVFQNLLKEVFKNSGMLAGEQIAPAAPQPVARKKVKKLKHISQRLYGDSFSPDPSLPAKREQRKEQLKALNNQQLKDPEGYIYVISHPNETGRKGRVSVGCTCDYDVRLVQYNRGDSDEEYKIEYSQPVANRHIAETAIHYLLHPVRVGTTEWFQMSVADAVAIERNMDVERFMSSETYDEENYVRWRRTLGNTQRVLAETANA